MKITLKVDSKEISRLITGLRKVISDNESLLKYSNLSVEARFIAERNIEESERLIKLIQNAHAAQTLQYMHKETKNDKPET